MTTIPSTTSLYSAVLGGIADAQTQITQIGARVSSGNNASDLEGYAPQDQTIVAMGAVQSQVTGYLSTGSVLTAKLSAQDSGLTSLSDSAASALKAVQSAIAAGSGSTLMQSLQSAFTNAAAALNTTYNGEYVFGGGQVGKEAFTGTTLNDLTSAPSIASLFNNDSHIQTAQVTQTQSLQTGFLANQLGTPLMTALQAIVTYSQGANGPLTGTLTDAQTTFLESQISGLTSAVQGVNTATAQNGEIQSEVANAQTSLSDQQTQLQGLLGNITNTNMAQASADLQQAQLALQASARVFTVLQNASLVTLLPSSPTTG